ncbi:cytochrome d ubiquinol oxidase subunit II, partial [Burkholderia pseudomallei]
AALAWLASRGLRGGGESYPIDATSGLVFVAFSGLPIRIWPHVAPPSMTLWSAASGSASVEFLMFGSAFMVPVLLCYVCWCSWGVGGWGR